MPRWLLHSAVALLLFGVWAVIPRALGRLSGAEQQVLSTVGMLPVIAFLAGSRRARGGARPFRGTLLALVAGLLSGLGNAAYYQALARGGSASALAPLTALYPAVTLVLSMLILRERHGPIQLAGLVVALAAIYLFNVEPGTSAALGGLGWVLAPIALWGASAVVQKLSTNDVSAERSALWFLAASIPLALAMVALGAPIRWALAPGELALVTLLGVLMGLGNLSLLAAFGADGKAGVVTALTGLYWIVAVPLGMLLFGERVDARRGMGLALTAVAILALSRERKVAA